MGISLPSLPAPNQPVITDGAAPSLLGLLLSAYQQGVPVGAQGYQESANRDQRASISSAELAVQNKHLDFQIAQEKTRQAQLKAQGEGMQMLLARLAPPAAAEMGPMGNPVHYGGFGGTGGAPPAPPAPPQPWTPANDAPLPQVQQTPGGPQPTAAASSPEISQLYATLAGITRGMDPMAAGGFVHEALPVLMDQAKLGAQSEKLRRIDAMLSTVPADKRDAARAVITFAELGANLPKEMQQTLWPSLFPSDGGNAPEALNAFSTLFKTGAFTAGQAARTAGITLPAGTPTGVKYVPPVNPLARALAGQGVRAAQMSNLATEMTVANATIDAWSKDHPDGLSWLGQFKKNTAGSGLVSTIVNGGLTKLVKGDEAAAINAMYDFAQGWAHLTSGVRITDSQFERIMHNSTPERSDTPQSRQFKQNMRSVMIQGAQDISRGIRTPTQVIDGALQLQWTPDQRRMLQEEKGAAVRYEQMTKKGTGPVPISAAPPGDPQAMQDQIDQLRALAAAALANQSPEP